MNLTTAPYTLTQNDAVTWLKSLDSDSVDLCITDPAYESLEKHRSVGTTTRLTESWFDIFPNTRFPELFSEIYRVLKPNSHLYLFCDHETAFLVKDMGVAAGFKFWKPIIWDKVRIGMGYHYRARYEMILFYEKGKRKLSNLGIPDVLEVPRFKGGYPTEKPVALLETLVAQSSSEGQVILDPFMGSGSTGVAAVKNGRRFWGCDLAENAVKTTQGRLDYYTKSTLEVA